MTADDKASILYDYIVLGDSMENIADDNMINTSDVSAIVRSYGFNYIKRGSYQSGQHRGAFKGGYRYNYTVNNQRYSYIYHIDEDDIFDFVRKYSWATVENPCNYEEFERFIQSRAKSEAETAIRKQQQAQLEQQRRAEEQRRAAERQRQIDAENRRRAEAQRQRQIAEENRRRQEEYNAQCYKNLYNEGVKLFEEKNFNLALDRFRNAEKYISYGSSDMADMVNVYIAYTLNQFSNRSDFASEISARMKKRIYTVGYKPSCDDYYILANALLALGYKNDACKIYFKAGNVAYDKGDFVLADKLYSEARRNTGMYSGDSKENPFRIAFAKGRTENLTNADYEDMIFWYNKSIENGVEVGYSYGNMAWAYKMLGRYDEAVKSAKDAILFGNRDEYVYRHLVNAYWGLKDYNGVIDASNKMKAQRYIPNYFQIGYSYFELGDYDASEAAYKEDIRLKDTANSYWNLAIIYNDKKSLYTEAVKYAETAIQRYSQEDRDKYGADALKIANNANDTAAYNRMLQYLPKEQERLEQEKREREIAEENRRKEQERLEREKKAALGRRRDNELMILF